MFHVPFVNDWMWIQQIFKGIPTKFGLHTQKKQAALAFKKIAPNFMLWVKYADERFQLYKNPSVNSVGSCGMVLFCVIREVTPVNVWYAASLSDSFKH